MVDNTQYATISSSDKYRCTLLEMWDAIKLNEAAVRTLYLQVSPALEEGIPPAAISITGEEQNGANNLISLVLGMWEELEPKVQGKDIAPEFMSYERYYNEPSLLLKDTAKLFKMIRTIRRVLEELGVTKIEQEVR